LNSTSSPCPEKQSFAPWRERRDPPRVLFIRLHALGDIALTLPAALGFRRRCPDSRVDALTHSSAAPFLRSLSLYDEVLEFPLTTDRVERALHAVQIGSIVDGRKYDLIVDLQRNWLTRAIRRIAAPPAWGEFDRFSPESAAERVRKTVERCGFPGFLPVFEFSVDGETDEKARSLLERSGYDPDKKLVALNPAGLWTTRHWPRENYVDLGRLWREHEPVQFLLVGTDKIRDSAEWIQSQLGSDVINLVEQTTITTAYALLGRCAAIISEDSGLMHLAWTRGVPVVALFGSSRHVWAAPVGPAVRVFHSGDLECGQCMAPECRFGDVHCLARHSARTVFEAALELLSQHEGVSS
jgi:heptosyltransferase-2